MKKFILAFLVAALLAAPADSANHKPKPFDSVRALAWTTEMIVGFDSETDQAITVERFGNHCTITSINEKEHYWLTAAHCVADEEMENVVARDYVIGNPEVGYTAAAVVAFDMKEDLAIMAAPGVTVRALKVSDHMVTYGDKLKVIGHPFGWDQAVLFVGIVAHPSIQFESDYKACMIYQLAGAPGNSGSAVLDSHDEIVSVLQISWDRTFAPVTGGAPQQVLIDFVAPYVK